jgi:hypothetical protein
MSERSERIVRHSAVEPRDGAELFGGRGEGRAELFGGRGEGRAELFGGRGEGRAERSEGPA